MWHAGGGLERQGSMQPDEWPGAATGDMGRHIRACNNAVLPGGRIALRIGAARIGWVKPALAAMLAGLPAIGRAADGLTLHDGARLDEVAAAAAAQGFGRRRGEMFDVRADADPDGPALATIDRGALPAFGIGACGVHVNGLVRRPDGVWLWVARRAADKALDPGKLDHIVAGGVCSGMSAWQTLLKEAAEEAAIPRDLAATAVATGCVAYAMERDEGLRRDRLMCFDLWLPEDFRPTPADGEVETFALWPLERVLAAVRATDEFKFNVNLVLIDLFLRRGMLDPAEASGLRRALDAGAASPPIGGSAPASGSASGSGPASPDAACG
jgi:8-oxo-dGTP pyrophosphatase MutT (NUDIX family)